MGKKLLLPVNLLLIIGIFFGVVFAVFTPFGTGFDEEHHLARVYDISGLHMLPNRSIYDKTVYFVEFHLLSYWRRFYRNEGFVMFKPESFLVRGNYDSMEIQSTMSVYPPAMFGGNPKRGIELMQGALALGTAERDDLFNIYLGIGLAYGKLKNTAEARRWLAMALELYPGSAYAKTEYEKLGKG